MTSVLFNSKEVFGILENEEFRGDHQIPTCNISKIGRIQAARRPFRRFPNNTYSSRRSSNNLNTSKLPG